MNRTKPQRASRAVPSKHTRANRPVRNQQASRRITTSSRQSRRPINSTPISRLFSTDTASPDDATPRSIPSAKIQKTDVRADFTSAISDEMLITLSMNFNNSGANHRELCDNLRKNNLISTPLIEYAFRKSDRRFFDPSVQPYEDKPHDIGGGATITAAHMHAIALEALGDAILPAKTTGEVPVKSFADIGAGSGFATAVFGHIIKALRMNPLHAENAKRSRATGIEIHPGLAAQAEDNIRHCDPDLMKNSPSVLQAVSEQPSVGGPAPLVQMIVADAFNSTKPLPNGPFDAVHCGVAVERVPLSLLSQLKPGGRLVIPVKIPHLNEQDLTLFTRKSVVDNDIVNDDEDFFQKSLQIQNSNDHNAIQEFLTTFFTKKVILRCLYSMAHSEQSVPLNAPAINTAEHQEKNASLSTFFQKTTALSPEDSAKAQQKVLQQQQQEKAAKLVAYQEELDAKQQQLDTTSEEIRQWHKNYLEQSNGRKPSLKEMQNDHKLNNYLIIVKELRVKISKLEYAIVSLQSDAKNAPQKH